MLSDYKDFKRIFILFFAGASCGVSLSFIYLIPLLIFGYFYFIKILLITKSNDVSFFNGCTFGFGFFLGCLHWIVYPFLVYDKHLILAPFVLILFPLFLSSFFGLAALGINILNKLIRKDLLFFRISIFSTTLFFFEFRGTRETKAAGVFRHAQSSSTAAVWHARCRGPHGERASDEAYGAALLALRVLTRVHARRLRVHIDAGRDAGRGAATRAGDFGRRFGR